MVNATVTAEGPTRVVKIKTGEFHHLIATGSLPKALKALGYDLTEQMNITYCGWDSGLGYYQVVQTS
jgi:hypothetical protein